MISRLSFTPPLFLDFRQAMCLVPVDQISHCHFPILATSQEPQAPPQFLFILQKVSSFQLKFGVHF